MGMPYFRTQVGSRVSEDARAKGAKNIEFTSMKTVHLVHKIELSIAQ